MQLYAGLSTDFIQDNVHNRIAEKLRPAAERFTRGESGVPFDAEDIIRRGMERQSARDHLP